jgi:hypothetical protein
MNDIRKLSNISKGVIDYAEKQQKNTQNEENIIVEDKSPFNLLKKIPDETIMEYLKKRIVNATTTTH